MIRVAIFTDNRYGIGFIRKIVLKLFERKYIKKVEFVKTHTPALIEKCRNVGSKVKSIIREVDRILIIIDKEDIHKFDENKEIWKHLKDLREEDKSKIKVIATEPELEEWICISLGLWFDKTGINKSSKPSEILKREKKYKKEKLSKYVDILDFNKLLKESKSFRELLESLK